MLIFGESENDTNALKAFLEGLGVSDGLDVVAHRQPQVLIKDATTRSAPARADAITAVVDAAMVDRDIVAVFAHEDCDAVEPAHVDLAAKIEAAFAAKGYDFVFAATPAWEMETWLMQWPDALALYRPSWRDVSGYSGRNVGMIANAKEDLTRSLRPGRGRTRDYRESDAPAIARVVASQGWTRSPRATSGSWSAFVSRADGARSGAA